MDEHYRRLVGAVLLVIAVAVAWTGWSSLRGAPQSTVIAAAPRVLDVPLDRPALPAGPAGGAASSPPESVPPLATSVEAASLAIPSTESKSASAAPTGPRVHVVGAVRRVGVYTLPAKARVIDALQKAGGARPDADLEAINLADFARDGEQILVPSRRMTRAAVPRSVPPAMGIVRLPAVRNLSRAASAPTRTLGRYRSADVALPGGSGAASSAADTVVNVNTAGLEELDTLPGVGPATAQAIVDHRREHGPFQRPEDLLNVRGIGEKKLAAMLPRVRVR